MLVEQTHECLVKKHAKPARCEQRFLYAHFETDISGKRHIPVGSVAVNDEGMAASFIDTSVGADFCDWLFSKEHAHYFCVFHNLMSYDYSFIMRYLQENRVYPSVIVKGPKFLQIYVEQLDTTIRDSLAFLLMPLRAMPCQKFSKFMRKMECFRSCFQKERTLTIVGPFQTIYYARKLAKNRVWRILWMA